MFLSNNGPALPATTLADYCYAYMFSVCNSLIEAPALPATTLAYFCYGSMFDECTSLTTTSSLAATTMAESCCYGMFWGCTSLTTAPTMAATTLAKKCCYGMFYDCSSLTEAPALPATTLADSCYYEMFKGCSSLIVTETAPCQQWLIPAPETASGSLTNMFSETSGTMNGTPQVNTMYYIASYPTTAIEDAADNKIEYVVYSNNRQIFVQGAEGHAVTLYDLSGRIVAKTTTANDTQGFAVHTAGIYLVSVDGMKETKKVVVR